MNISLSLNDPYYPEELRHIYQPPQQLYCRGNIELLKRPKFSIVGTRKASSWGLRHAREMAREIAENGFVVVSGLAYGIDAAAHEGSMETGQTIAVLAHGVDKIDPPYHHALAEKILAHGGLLISENLGMTGLPKIEYLRRNRIISGLSQGVLLLEAPLKSGAMNTIAHARQQDKDIFCLPVKPEDFAQGNLACLKNFGIPVCSPKDVLSFYGKVVKEKSTNKDPLLQILKQGAFSFEALASQFKDSEALQKKLFTLEMEGKIYRNFQQEYERLSS